MCHQSVGLIQSIIEKAGIPTVSVTLLSKASSRKQAFRRSLLHCFVESQNGSLRRGHYSSISRWVIPWEPPTTLRYKYGSSCRHSRCFQKPHRPPLFGISTPRADPYCLENRRINRSSSLGLA